jgi:hypothetical protein
MRCCSLGRDLGPPFKPLRYPAREEEPALWSGRRLCLTILVGVFSLLTVSALPPREKG